MEFKECELIIWNDGIYKLVKLIDMVVLVHVYVFVSFEFEDGIVVRF